MLIKVLATPLLKEGRKHCGAPSSPGADAPLGLRWARHWGHTLRGMDPAAGEGREQWWAHVEPVDGGCPRHELYIPGPAAQCMLNAWLSF